MDIAKGAGRKVGKPQGLLHQEAYEEAGIRGKFLKNFPITARIGKSTNGSVEQIIVTYYPLLVTHQEDKWPEGDKRQRHWALLEDAVRVADRDDLRQLVKQFSDIQHWVIEDAKLKKARLKEKLKKAQ